MKTIPCPTCSRPVLRLISTVTGKPIVVDSDPGLVYAVESSPPDGSWDAGLRGRPFIARAEHECVNGKNGKRG